MPAVVTQRAQRVRIVGAGMTGSLMAIFLARKGYDVGIYESRGDPRGGFTGPSKSLNMTLSKRGLAVLEEVDLKESILAITVMVKQRVVHTPDRPDVTIPYGREEDGEVLHAIERHRLNLALMEAAEALPNVTIFFEKKLLDLDRAERRLFFRDRETDGLLEVPYDFVIGADGSSSAICHKMQCGERAHYHKEPLDWDYKELLLPATVDGSYRLYPHALHDWPSGDCMLMALPNLDGSFNCLCSMPAEGEPSFAWLSYEKRIRPFFEERFPDVLPLIPDLVPQFTNAVRSSFVTVKTSQWYSGDQVVLVGDSAHAVVPFYGQGMIAGFEDCSVLARSLERNPENLETAFAEYQQERKRNTDALADLSVRNFVELRDTIRDPRLVLRKRFEARFSRWFPRHWHPMYRMIAHTTIPYADARERYEWQQRLARRLGLDLLLGVCALAVRSWRTITGRLGRVATRPPRSTPDERPRRAGAGWHAEPQPGRKATTSQETATPTV